MDPHFSRQAVSSKTMKRLLLSAVLTTLVFINTLIFGFVAVYRFCTNSTYIQMNPDDHLMWQYYMLTELDPHYGFGCSEYYKNGKLYNVTCDPYPLGALMRGSGSGGYGGGYGENTTTVEGKASSAAPGAAAPEAAAEAEADTKIKIKMPAIPVPGGGGGADYSVGVGYQRTSSKATTVTTFDEHFTSLLDELSSSGVEPAENTLPTLATLATSETSFERVSIDGDDDEPKTKDAEDTKKHSTMDIYHLIFPQFPKRRRLKHKPRAAKAAHKDRAQITQTTNL